MLRNKYYHFVNIPVEHRVSNLRKPKFYSELGNNAAGCSLFRREKLAIALYPDPEE